MLLLLVYVVGSADVVDMIVVGADIYCGCVVDGAGAGVCVVVVIAVVVGVVCYVVNCSVVATVAGYAAVAVVGLVCIFLARRVLVI